MADPTFRANDGTRFDYLSDGSLRIARDRLPEPHAEDTVHVLLRLEAGEWPHLVEAIERAKAASTAAGP